MTSTFARPENALKRAEELINVGQNRDALESLHSLITSRRFRSWTRTHEKLMLKFVELCVDTRSGRHAKDALVHYRNICQHVNITSLEEVINRFLQLATDKAEFARNQGASLSLDEVDDLEADQKPEDLMLSYVSGLKGNDRSDREIVTPWFKFLWGTYRTVLDVLRNNSRLEVLYAMTAHRAFQFCKTYKRTTEFRRLCEIIRNHLQNMNKYRDHPDLTAPDTLQLYLDTRFEQLKVATELHLWQEAFRSIEDIHGLMFMVKRTPKSSLMVVYYSKLSEIFWRSSNHLYHAYALLKLFSVQKGFNKNLSQKDLQLLASSVVLAALSVPPYDRSYVASHLELETERERNSRVANLIAFDVESKLENREELSRSSLLSELVAKGVRNCATQEVKDLYQILEHESLTLDVATKVEPLLTKITKMETQLSQYVPSLEKLAALRLLHQVSQVYQTINIDVLSTIIPFFGFKTVEKISADAVKNKFLTMKLDHRKGAVFFDKSLESEGMQHHLTAFAESFSKLRAMICPPVKGISKLAETSPDLMEVVEKEHMRALARKAIIEKRKEEREQQLLEMERQEEAKRLKRQKTTEETEQRRLATEFEQMKNQRILREIQARELEGAQALLQEAEKRSKRKGNRTVLDTEKITKQSLMELAVSEQLRAKQLMEKRLQKLGKTMDHLERAKCEEAAPLIEAAFKQRLQQEEALFQLDQQEEIDASRQRHAGDLAEKRRVFRMLENSKILRERVMSVRRAEFDRLKEERVEMIKSRKKEKEAVKKKMIHFLKSEEERRKRLLEEEEIRKLQEMERRKREEAEYQAKEDEIAERQRKRLQEMEEKERQRRDETLGKSAATVAPAPAPAPVAAGKYVPKFKRMGAAPSSPPETDKWRDDRRPAFGGPRSTRNFR